MIVALVHDWLNGMRGGEMVLQAIASIFPRSVIYTLFCDPEMISDDLRKHEIKTSFVQNLPKRKDHYRHYLPLFPRAIESFDMRDKDLVISSSHCVAKGAKTGPDTLHICYCYSPMRYVWDRFDDYFRRESMSRVRYAVIKYLTRRLREWDRDTAKRVDLFIADSQFVQKRIGKYYNRKSILIYPPVDTEYYTPGFAGGGKYFLAAGALVPYKKIDLVVEAFRGLKEKLVVIGGGPDLEKLSGEAPSNVEFTGWVSRERLREYYRDCRALIFPGVEDFGIIPVEVQACGRPVIAYGEGGLKETVVGPSLDSALEYGGFKSGIFFMNQNINDIREAVRVFPALQFDSAGIRDHATRFSKERFYSEISELLNEAVGLFRSQGKTGLEERLIGRDQRG